MDRIADPTLCIRVSEAEDGDRAARELLIRVYREAAKAKRLDDLPIAARVYVQEVIDANGGKLPPSAGGRPRAKHREFALAVAVEVERELGRSIRAAVRVVALRAGAAAARVGKKMRPFSGEPTVEAAYDRWRNTRELRAEMDRRRRESPRALPKVNLAALAELEPATLPKPPRIKPR